MIEKVKVYGLTGNIGSGKSTVAAWLKERGAAIIDADALARAATQDKEVLAMIAAQLGQELINQGQLNRAATAQKVFHDKEALKKLNAIVHPWVARERERLTQEYLKNPPLAKLIIHDIPLLYENNLEKGLDGVIVVYAPLDTHVKRVVERSNFSEADIRARDLAQLSLEEKVKRATITIDNGGGRETLEVELKLKLHSLLTL